MENTTTRETADAIRKRLETAESTKRGAARLLRDGEPGSAEAFERAESECRQLSAALQIAVEDENDERDRRSDAEREATAVRLEAEAGEFSLEKRNAFAAEIVAEAVEIEAKLVALYERQENAIDAARAAKERIAREAAKAGVRAPAIPVWAGFVGEVGSAIHNAHQQRKPIVPRGLTPEIRHLKESRVTIQAERARNMIAPRRFGA